MTKTFSIKTLGCKLNQYDSDQIVETFIDAGWRIRPFGEEVDLVVVNTCTVTERSDKSSRNCIRQGARSSKTKKAIVTGCLVNRDRLNIESMPEVDTVYNIQEQESIRAIANRYLPEDSTEPSPTDHFRTRRHLKIQDGCDGGCSYCIVPLVRGAPKSRNRVNILEQAKQLIDVGCPEIVLTGITIGKYLDGNKDLTALAEDIVDLPGNFRLRITSIEPLHLTDRLIDLLAHEKICTHLHLPLQSGSDRVLSAMQRPYRIKDYCQVIDRLTSRYPTIAIGTDVIVGFPTEEEQDFQQSLQMVKDIGFAYVHQFSYSCRPGTKASELKEDISPQQNAERVHRLRELAAEVGLAYRRRFVGQTLACVIASDRKGTVYKAVSDNYIKMDLMASKGNATARGTIAPVQLLETGLGSTRGMLVS